MITVLTRPIAVGMVAAVSGTLDHEQQVDDLTGGLACLADDQVLVIDLSDLVLARSGVVGRLADEFGKRLSGDNVRVVASRLTARLLLLRTGVRPVFASVADALEPRAAAGVGV